MVDGALNAAVAAPELGAADATAGAAAPGDAPDSLTGPSGAAGAAAPAAAAARGAPGAQESVGAADAAADGGAQAADEDLAVGDSDEELVNDGEEGGNMVLAQYEKVRADL